MLKKEINVYSKEHDIKGVIKDYGVVTKLFFTYKGKDVEIGLRANPLEYTNYEEIGQQIIDTYIANLVTERKKVCLHDWHIREHTRSSGEKYCTAHGIVTGHPRLQDSIFCNTSKIKTMYINLEEDELVVITRNTEYHCPLAYCAWDGQDICTHVVPDYEKIKVQYKDCIPTPTIEPGKVLLVLSDFREYYFHTLYYVPVDSADNKPCISHGHAHVGMFQDSFLVYVDGQPIDLRYFPHMQNIEFYTERTNGLPFYIENIGGSVLYAKTSVGTIKLAPGERKEVKKENAESDTPILPRGDLYPAGIIE